MASVSRRTRPPAIEILRPLNALMAGSGVFIGGVVAVSTGILAWDTFLRVALAYIAAFTATGAGNTLNDIVDAETDRINHPYRPIPMGALTSTQAKHITVLGFGITLILALLINFLTFIVAVVNVSLMVGYEFSLKKKGLAGNLTISYLTGSVFLFGGVSTLQNGSIADMISADATRVTLILAFLAFLASAGREIIKDIEDMEGDTDRLTLPKRIGKGKAAALAGVLILTAVGLSWLPYYLGILDTVYYLGIVLLADAVFVFSAAVGASTPKRSERLAKIAMFIALVAFFAGAVV